MSVTDRTAPYCKVCRRRTMCRHAISPKAILSMTLAAVQKRKWRAKQRAKGIDPYAVKKKAKRDPIDPMIDKLARDIIAKIGANLIEQIKELR